MMQASAIRRCSADEGTAVDKGRLLTVMTALAWGFEARSEEVPAAAPGHTGLVGDRVDGLVDPEDAGAVVAGHPAEVFVEAGDADPDLGPGHVVGLALDRGPARRSRPGGCRRRGCRRTCRSGGRRSAGRCARSAAASPRRCRAGSRRSPSTKICVSGSKRSRRVGLSDLAHARPLIAEGVEDAVAPDRPVREGDEGVAVGARRAGARPGTARGRRRRARSPSGGPGCRRSRRPRSMRFAVDLDPAVDVAEALEAGGHVVAPARWRARGRVGQRLAEDLSGGVGKVEVVG